jgi:hypothetical protein
MGKGTHIYEQGEGRICRSVGNKGGDMLQQRMIRETPNFYEKVV